MSNFIITNNYNPQQNNNTMPKDTSIKSVLIIGSGPIVIGQACEFDYAGSQSARSLREEGIEVILINSNPATIMTDPSMADHVYLKPLTTKSIIEILKAHPQIDAVLPTMGGQTALNLAIEAEEKGIWKDFGVRLIGVDINAINITEDREKFKVLLNQIGIPQAPAKQLIPFKRKRNCSRIWFSISYSSFLYIRWNRCCFCAS